MLTKRELLVGSFTRLMPKSATCMGMARLHPLVPGHAATVVHGDDDVAPSVRFFTHSKCTATCMHHHMICSRGRANCWTRCSSTRHTNYGNEMLRICSPALHPTVALMATWTIVRPDGICAETHQKTGSDCSTLARA